ncbi:hypothetical protein RJZ90_006186 [Blastomyces dermatitidis]
MSTIDETASVTQPGRLLDRCRMTRRGGSASRDGVNKTKDGVPDVEVPGFDVLGLSGGKPLDDQMYQPPVVLVVEVGPLKARKQICYIRSHISIAYS